MVIWQKRTGGHPEKALLRECFAGWLPDELLWDGKEQFGDGSGAGSVLADATLGAFATA